MAKSIRVGGQPLTYRFDLKAWLEIEEAFGSLEEMNRKVKVKDHPMTANLKMLSIIATRGAVHRDGKEAEPVTMGMLAESLSPSEMSFAVMQAQAAILAGMERKHVDDEDEDVDVVAEELAKKRAAAQAPGKSSPGD